uniref:Uncharacterized protein n=1 Tax=Arundo donax TaxID=35708 RepID=A0A0A9E613_ARUDO
MAVKLKRRASNTRSNPNRDPASTAATHFPRSMYPIEIRSAGPRAWKRLGIPPLASRDPTLC